MEERANPCVQEPTVDPAVMSFLAAAAASTPSSDPESMAGGGDSASTGGEEHVGVEGAAAGTRADDGIAEEPSAGSFGFSYSRWDKVW